MDEQSAWLKSRRRKRLRLLAVALCFSLLVTAYPDMLQTLYVTAGTWEGDDTLSVTRFADLPGEVREQTVPVGTDRSELALPDTLEAFVTVDTGDATEDGAKPGEGDKDEDTDEDGGTPGEGEEGGETPDDGDDKGDDIPGGDDNHSDVEKNDGSGDDSNDDEKNDGQNDSEGTPGGDISGGTGDNGAETSDGSENSNGADGDESPAVENNGDTRSADGSADKDGGTGTDAPETSDSADNRIMAGWHVRTGSFVMPVYASENPQDGVAGTLTDGRDDTGKTAAPADSDRTTGGDSSSAEHTAAPETRVTIENVTWQSDPAYDESVEGTYTFTAVLPDGYALSEGVSLPQITVTVESGITAVIQALLDRIAALPDSQEYLEKEPDIDSWEGDEEDYEEAYTEWMEGLQDYAKEALAIQDEIGKLTEEEQALIPQEAFDKLAAWAEIAETLSEDTMVMAAAAHTHNGITFNEWTSTDHLPSEGNYYLANNVTLDSASNDLITDTLNLCLNGKEIKKDVASNYYIFEMHGGTLNLYDCNGSGQLYCTSKAQVKVIAVAQGGTLNLYGGTLKQGDGNVAVVGVKEYDGDYKGGTVNVHGGKIESGSYGIIVDPYLTASSVVIDGGYIGSGTYAVRVENTNSTVTIAGNATLTKPISTRSAVIASGTGATGLTKTCKIAFTNVAEGTTVVKNSTDTEHYQLVSDTYGLAAKDGDLVAVNRNKIHSVTYNKNGGTIENEDRYKSYAEGVGLTLPTPTREHYKFGGWYENSGFTGNEVKSISATATGNKIYYAKWTADTYTVTYNKNSGTIANENNYTSYAYGTELTLPTPTRTGYTFGGWYENADFTGNKVTSISDTDTGNKEYYAKWTANSYTVTFDKNGGDTLSKASQSVTYGSTYGTLATVSRTGYGFDGWYTAASGGSKVESGTTVATAENHTLYAHWTANSYTVTFDKNGGDTLSKASQSVTYGSTYGTLATVSRTGYSFDGWYTAASGGDKVESGTTVTTAGNHTLYAHWTANSYTVTFDKNGGDTLSKASQSVTYGSTYGTLATVSRTGYGFDGWYTAASGGSKVESGTTVTTAGNHTLYAHWTAKTYIISYKGLENATLTTKPTEHTYGTGTAVGNPTKTGYTFAGWKINNGSAVTKDLSLSATGYTAAITLTATWTANQYRVNFNYQGATGDNGTTEKSVTYNETYGTLPAPVRTGYAFKGWFTLANGEGSQVEDTTPVKITAAQTLYAYWVDAVLPDKPVLQSDVTLPTGWTNTQKTIPLTLSDNVGVTKLLVKIDSGGYTEVSGFTGNGTAAYDYNYTVSEGNHTYQFKAVDAAGNESPDSEEFRVMLDTGDPAFSEGPTVKNITADSADITFTPSEGGKAYWIVDPTGTPANAQAVISDAQDDSQKGGVKAVTGGTSADIAVTDLTPGAVHKVYVVLEDAAGNLSAVKEAVFGTRPEVPVIKLDDLIKDYDNEKVKVPDDFGDVEVYTDPDDPSGSVITPGDDGFLTVEPGKPIYIRYPEKTEGDVIVPPSVSVKIDIPGRPAAPPAKEVAVTGTTVTVKDPADGEEYILVEKGSLPESAEPNWNDADKVNETGEFTGLAPNKEYDLYVRKKATEDDFASESAKTPVRTYVTINEPQITGEGKGEDGNTAPKPAKPDEGGATVTYTGTYEEEYTPVILVDGKEIIPGADIPGAEGSEMTWNEKTGKGEWKYVYPIPDGVPAIGITVTFRKRAVTGITVDPERLTIHADDTANLDAIQAGDVTPLTAYLKGKCSVEAAYDNRTTGAVPAEALSYATTESLEPKGGTYHYTVSADGKSSGISLTVAPVDAAVTAPAGLLKTQKADGYTQEEVGAWLPAQVTVSYTGTGYTARKEDRDVTWDTAPIGSGSGAQTGKETISGTVELPAWATGVDTVSMEIEFVDRNVLNDSQMRLTQRGFTYGEKKLPDPNGSVTVRDTNPSYTYLYSADGGITWVPAESLTVSEGGYVIPGEYRVKMTYRGDSYAGVKEVSFTVAKKKLKISKGTLEAESRNYDGTTDARLREGGEAALSGTVEGDDVTLGGTLEARFAGKGPKRNIPVSVTGFRLQGADAGCYELADTKVTLYATINKEDGTPPPAGGSGSSSGNNGGGDNNGSGGNNGGGDNNGSGGNNGGDNGNGGNNNDINSSDGNNNGGSTKPGDNNGGTKPGDNNGGTKPGDNNGGTKPGDKTDGTKPGDNNGGTKPGDNNGGTKPGDNNGGTKPGDNNGGTKPGDNNGGTKPGDNNGGTKPGDKTDGGTGPEGDDSDPGEGKTKTVPAVIEGGKIVIDSGKTGDSGNGGGKNTGGSGNGGTGGEGENNGTGANGGKIATGNVPGMTGAGSDPQNGTTAGENTMRTMLKVGEGAVIIRVVCEEPELTAGVPDTVAVANAVLTTGQMQSVNGGDTIEIRVEVRDITESVTGQEQEVMESALAQLRGERKEITLGMYVDISMFIKVGGGEWEAVTTSNESIEVVVGIPEEMRSDGREYYIIRSHGGECDILTDMDDASDTITISTDRFSSYAIAYEETDGTGADSGAKCGLCHMCPTFLGICCFIWLVVIMAVILTVILVVVYQRKKGETEGKR